MSGETENQQQNKTLQSVLSGVYSKNKRRIGYTVGAYGSVLNALQRLEEQGGSQSIMGKGKIDWEKVQGLSYDPSTGFSSTDEGIWKMAVKFKGAIPIFNRETAQYFIETLPGQQKDIIGNDEFPNNFEATTCTGDFKVGAYLDIAKNGVDYFNKEYLNVTTSKWTQEIVQHIVNEGWVVAQVIFPQQKEYFIVKVLGHDGSAGTGSACITLNTPILGAYGWNNIGIALKAKVTPQEGQGNQSEIVQIIPSDGKYFFSCNGNSYDYETGTIKNFDIQHFKDMKDRQDTISSELVELQNPEVKECFVRLFIPPNSRAAAESYFNSKNFSPLPLVYQEEFASHLTTAESQSYENLVFNVADGNLSVVVDYGHHGVGPEENWRFETEIPMIKSLANKLVSMFEKNKITVYVNKVSSKGGLPAASAMEAVAKNATCIMSVHFNAGPPSARHTIVFYKENGHPQSKKLAEEVYKSIMNNGFRPQTRGSGAMNQKDRAGFLNTVGQSCPAILLEPGFLTNKEDAEFFANENNMLILANKIYNGVVAWFNSYKQEHERIKQNQNQN